MVTVAEKNDALKSGVLPDQSEDGDLIHRFLDGDSSAFEALVRKYQGPIARLCYSVLQNEARIPDVVQEVFVSVYQALATFRGEASFKTWLYRIAVHEALRFAKRASRLEKMFAETDEDDISHLYDRALSLQISDESPEGNALSEQQKKIVQDAMACLSENHHVVLNLHYVDGLSVEEMAEVLALPVGSVKSRLYYARQQLKQLLIPVFN